MKKSFLIFALFISCLCAKAQSIIPQVNENVELMSILSRMAGFPEYHMDMAGQYIKDMDSYFKDNTDHPAVHYMKGLRNKYGISFDAVMSMAIHLDNRNGTLSLVEEDIPTLEKRWKNVDKDEFLSYLNSFYKDTNFNEFFKVHKDLYNKGLKSFINHYLDENKYPDFVKELEPAATDLFMSSRWSMAKQAYGNWKTVINESLVRAAVICYMLDKEYKPEEIKNELLEQVQRNFRWMPELVSLLRKYEKKQSKYENFDCFYPKIIDFFMDYAKNESERFDILK